MYLHTNSVIIQQQLDRRLRMPRNDSPSKSLPVFHGCSQVKSRMELIRSLETDWEIRWGHG